MIKIEGENGGRVAQLGEHLFCKHVFISPKPLNRRLLTVQNPLLVGLLIGLQILRIRCPNLDKHRQMVNDVNVFDSIVAFSA
jgi:hypothetical protein